MIERGWREQLRRVSELALLGIVAAILCVPVVTTAAVVAALSSAVAHWVEHNELPPCRSMGAQLRRRLLPGIAVSAVGLLAVLLVVLQVRWLSTGAVPGGGVGLCALLVATACLLSIVLLGVPLLADGRTWRRALAGGWAAFRQAPFAAAAVLGSAFVAALLATLVPPIAPTLPALVVLSLHVVSRRLVLGRSDGDPVGGERRRSA